MRAPLASLGLAMLALLAACSSVELETESSATLPEPMRTYAWSSPPSSPVSAGSDEAPDAGQIRSAIEAELAANGLVPVDAAQADVLIDGGLGVATRERDNDPTYTFPLRERFEEATLTLQLRDPGTRASLWRGSATRRLRDVAHVSGVSELRWVPLDEPRRWELDRLAAELVQRLPTPPGG